MLFAEWPPFMFDDCKIKCPGLLTLFWERTSHKGEPPLIAIKLNAFIKG
jgi:hypothetical protein